MARTQAPRLERIGEFDPTAFAPGDDALARGEGALRALAEAMRASPKQHMGIWRDLRIKRRKTEVDMQVAVVVATGREQGLPTPVNAAVLDLVHQIEEGRRGMDWSNLAEIARRAALQPA